MFRVDTLIQSIKQKTGVFRITDKAYSALLAVGNILEYDDNYYYYNNRLIRIKGIDDTRLFIQVRDYGEYYLDEYVSYQVLFIYYCIISNTRYCLINGSEQETTGERHDPDFHNIVDCALVS